MEEKKGRKEEEGGRPRRMRERERERRKKKKGRNQSIRKKEKKKRSQMKGERWTKLPIQKNQVDLSLVELVTAGIKIG